ncbi:hypothetical protein [Mucilaginibacter sp. UYCu711]|uniref:hypothetical protein n=1 Tax=Mucilaginibacter sp. UYCu711 TaxID=3156339 RepID=UPI003D25B154
MKKVFVQLESGRGYGRDLLKGIYDYNNRFSKWKIIFEPAYYLKTTESRDLVKLIQLLKPDGCIIEHSEKINEKDYISPLFRPVGLSIKKTHHA